MGAPCRRVALCALALFRSGSATCPAGSLAAQEDTAGVVAGSVGRVFYANDFCGGGGAEVVDVSRTSTGQLVSGSRGSTNVGALSGGGAGCARRLEMLSWPAGTEDYTITTIATSSSTSGGATDFMGGPALDLHRGHVYYIYTDVASNSERVLERYNYNTGEKEELYRNTLADFPLTAPSLHASTFQLAVDVDRQILYWFSIENLFVGKIWSVDLSAGTPLTRASVTLALEIDETPAIGTATVMTDWFAMDVSCEGELYMAFYKKIVKWTPGDSAYTEVVPRAFLEEPDRCLGMDQGHSCQIHGLVVDDAAGKLYYGYGESSTVNYNVRSIDKDGGAASDERLVESIYYERGTHGQYLAALAADLVNRDFYVLGYAANSGGRSLYRVPMDLPGGRANLFGHFPGMPYRKHGERLLAGNCGAASYSNDFVGATMIDNCMPGSIQRYPAAGSGPIAVVPPSTAPTPPLACPTPAPLSAVVGKCGAAAVPSLDPHRHVFYGFDHRLGWGDLGAGELREMSGPGEIVNQQTILACA